MFSVDGALASNFSLSAKDIKLKQSAVDVARYVREIDQDTCIILCIHSFTECAHVH